MKGETPETRTAHARCMAAITRLNEAYAHPADNSPEANNERKAAEGEYHAAGKALVDAWTATAAP